MFSLLSFYCAVGVNLSLELKSICIIFLSGLPLIRKDDFVVGVCDFTERKPVLLKDQEEEIVTELLQKKSFYVWFVKKNGKQFIKDVTIRFFSRTFHKFLFKFPFPLSR